MKMTNWRILSAIGLAAIGLTGCDGGGGVASVNQAWYNVYGSYCGDQLRPGCDFFSNGDKITYNRTPLIADLEYGTYYYQDVYGYDRQFTGWARMTNDGIIYDENGRALNSNEKHGRDTITNAAAARKATIRGAAAGLQAKYGLDANVAMNAASALSDWALIGKSRKRTAADVAAFTQRLSGLNIAEVSAAMEASAKGDNGAVDAAVEKAARNWSTSPDTMKQILRDWFGEQQ
jgi:hypothetical protein